jgi:integrase
MAPNARQRMNRRIEPRTASRTSENADAELTVTFRNAWGEIERSYDLGTLEGLSPDLALLLADGLRNTQAAASADTLRHFWRGLNVFARFVREEYGIGSVRDLNTEMVKRYLGWLDRQTTRKGQPWAAVVRRNEYGKLRTLIHWTKRQHPERLPARLDFPHNPYPLADTKQQPRQRLSEAQLKAVLRACYEEIDAGWALFEKGRALLRALEVGEAVDDVQFAELLRKVRAVGGGLMPSQGTLLKNGIPQVLITEYGGTRTIAQSLQITSAIIAPYYVAIAIQTAANPEPLRWLSRDCLVPHPLDEHRKIVDWLKAKTGRYRKRVQRRSFDCRLVYAAPNLIEQVLAMTEPLRSHTPLKHRDKLFLFQSEKNRGVGVIVVPTLVSAIKRFVGRSNKRIAIWNRAAPPDRRRELLPDFAAAFLRGSVATAHYRASSGDLLAVQRLLNHADPVTTELYIAGPEAERLRQRAVAELQELMLAWVRDGSSQGGAEASGGGEPASAFSHTCLNPLAGPDTAPGRVCPRFGGCLNCPGLVIPVNADSLARLLAAKCRFEEARDRIDPARWQLLYAPSYRALVDDILPDFPPELAAVAEQQRAQLPLLPELE